MSNEDKDTDFFDTANEFLAYFNIPEEMTAHLKYLTVEKAVNDRELSKRIQNSFNDRNEPWRIQSAYDVGNWSKDDLRKFRQVGQTSLENHLYPWIEKHGILVLDDYRACNTRDDLIPKLKRGQDLADQHNPGWRDVTGMSAIHLAREQAAEQAHIRDYIENKIKVAVPHNKWNRLAQPLDKLAGTRSEPLRELFGKADGDGNHFDIVNDVTIAGRQAFVALGYNAEQITAIGEGLKAQSKELDLDMRQAFEAEFHADIAEQCAYAQEIAPNIDQHVRLHQKRRAYQS